MSNFTTPELRLGRQVLNSFIDALDWDQSVQTILQWVANRQPKRVCLCNVHSSVTALDNPTLAEALNTADMVLPDGAPIAWFLHRTGFPKQPRIAGPDLMWQLCDQIQSTNSSIFLFGSSPNTLSRLEKNLQRSFPKLKIAGALSPRFGKWSYEEEQEYLTAINNSNAGLIFIGLGCPKQEIWMADNRDRIHGVLLGVGAAFDFHAGTINRAPSLMQKAGLEWLHRLLSEPRRLWKRYLITNSRFLFHVGVQILRH